MKEQLIQMRDGTEIFCRSEETNLPKKARIHIVHGLAEHSGRYEEFMKFLTAHGYDVTAHDQRGHGNTAKANHHPYGYLGETISFDHLADDTFEVIRYFQKEDRHLPVILLGHSMGSFVVRRFIQLYGNSVKQTILSGTGSNIKAVASAGKLLAEWRESRLPEQQADEFLNGLIFGSYAKEFPGTPFNWLSRDPKSVQEYMEDEACGFVPTAQLFRVLLEGMNSIISPEFNQNIPDRLPILLISGTEDPVGEQAKGVWRTAKQLIKAGQQDVTVQLYEGGRHEMLLETNRTEVYNYIAGWMQRHEADD